MIKIILLLSQFVFAAPSTQSLEGTYTKSCYNDSDDVLSSHLKIQDTTWSLSHVAYEDNRCQTPYLVHEIKYSVKTNNNDADMTAIEASYTSFSDVVTGVLNQMGWCGFTDWQTNEAKVVSGKVCDSYVPPRAGDMTYSTFQVNEQNQILLGVASKGFNGKTPATRYKQLDQLPFKKD